MQHRTLGWQGLTTSAIGYGAMGISAYYGPGDEQEGIAAPSPALPGPLFPGPRFVPGVLPTAGRERI
jgi:hypothetical protein